MRGSINRYIEGYLRDPTLKGHWKESPSTADKLIVNCWFYKNEDGLLFF